MAPLIAGPRGGPAFWNQMFTLSLTLLLRKNPYISFQKVQETSPGAGLPALQLHCMLGAAVVSAPSFSPIGQCSVSFQICAQFLFCTLFALWRQNMWLDFSPSFWGFWNKPNHAGTTVCTDTLLQSEIIFCPFYNRKWLTASHRKFNAFPVCTCRQNILSLRSMSCGKLKS